MTEISREDKKYEKKEEEEGEEEELFDTEREDWKPFTPQKSPFERLWRKICAELAAIIIIREGAIGTFLRQFGCVMVFLSTFTIFYQVNRRLSILSIYHQYGPTHVNYPCFLWSEPIRIV